jgi:hypothetical protein
MTVDLTPPDTIDATGTDDVSDALSGWFTTEVPDGATVTLPDTAQYRLDYGLRIGSNGHARSHPDLPDRPCPRDLRIRGNARLFTDRTAKRWRLPSGGVETDPRLWNGLPLLLAYLPDGLNVDGLLIDHSGRAGGKYDPNREDWACVRLVGARHVDLVLVTLQGAPGDALAVNAAVVDGDLITCEDIALGGSQLRTIGRHAVTLQGVHGFTLAGNWVHDVNRFVLDAELQAGRDAVDVTIVGNRGDCGGLGFVQVKAPARALADGWTVDDNRFDRGHLTSSFGTVGTRPLPRNRARLRFTGNRSDDPRARSGRGPLLFVGHYDDVTITGNRDRCAHPDIAVRLNQCGGTIDTTTGNDWSPTT